MTIDYDLLLATLVVSTAFVRFIITFAWVLCDALDHVSDPYKMSLASDLLVWIATGILAIILYFGD